MCLKSQAADDRLFPAQKIKKILHEILGDLGGIRECALLNFPEHNNPGDHLIFLGEISYLVDVLGIKIKYISSRTNFSEAEMKKLSTTPIILSGGGCLGDIWIRDHQFHERIIAKYREHPVVIMPQCVYFKDAYLMQRTAKIFNSHPNLTLFVRDDSSFDRAKKVFENCKVIKAPDMAFQLAGMVNAWPNTRQRSEGLYLSRNDKESDKSFYPNSREFFGLVKEDWLTYRFRSVVFNKFRQLFLLLWKEGNQTRNHRLCSISRRIVFNAICQLSDYQIIITDRLHGHILAAILGIPHILLANNYHKNESFYNSWTHQIPFCKFARDSGETNTALRELLQGDDILSQRILKDKA